MTNYHDCKPPVTMFAHPYTQPQSTQTYLFYLIVAFCEVLNVHGAVNSVTLISDSGDNKPCGKNPTGKSPPQFFTAR